MVIGEGYGIDVAILQNVGVLGRPLESKGFVGTVRGCGQSAFEIDQSQIVGTENVADLLKEVSGAVALVNAVEGGAVPGIDAEGAVAGRGQGDVDSRLRRGGLRAAFWGGLGRWLRGCAPLTAEAAQRDETEGNEHTGQKPAEKSRKHHTLL